MAISISTVKARDALKARHDPYFVKLANGRFLGYRKITATTAGTWIARCRDDETGKQVSRSLGSFDELPASERYDAARREADGWFEHLGRGGKKEVVTVKEACERYIEHVRDDGRAKTADDMEARFRRWVFPETKLADLPLAKLTRERVIAWRRTLRKAPVVVSLLTLAQN